MFASTSKHLARAVTLARPTPTPHTIFSRLLSSTPRRCSEPVVPDTVPVTPPTPELPGSPLPAAYRSQTPNLPPAAHTASSTSSLSNFSPRRFNDLDPTQPYTLHVFSSRNNTILTLTTSPTPSSSFDPTPSGPIHPVAWVSSGSVGYKGASRGTYDAAVEVSLKMFKKLEEIVNPPTGTMGMKKKAILPKPTMVEIVWKGFGQGRDAVYRTLMGGEGDAIRHLVKRVTDATPLKIGGTRPKKRRVI